MNSYKLTFARSKFAKAMLKGVLNVIFMLQTTICFNSLQQIQGKEMVFLLTNVKK